MAQFPNISNGKSSDPPLITRCSDHAATLLRARRIGRRAMTVRIMEISRLSCSACDVRIPVGQSPHTMTKILTLVVASSLITLAPAQAPSNNPPPAAKPAQTLSADAWYAKGQAAEKDGDPVAAQKAYQAALQVNPKHANARYSLGQVKINATSIAAAGRESKFGAVIVPEFNITDASLQETLDHLRTIVDKQSQGKVASNFVVQDPQKTMSEVKINLRLKNMPARAVLTYVMDQCGAKARYDEFAIVITPK